MFNKSDEFPNKIFQNKESRDALIKPITLMNNETNEYYGQGTMVQYNHSISNDWPVLIYYNGATFCSHTAMKMIPNETNLVVSVFGNAIHALVNGTDGLYEFRYQTPYSVCQMAYVQKLIKGDGGWAYEIADIILKEYQ